jgi:2'-5' RNA ligase
MVRLFAGLSIPILLRQRLALLQGGIDGARWTDRENFHITLSFIGNVDEVMAEAAHDALTMIRTETFRLELKGTGSFAQGEDLKVLWVGVEKNEVLFRLKEKIDRAFEKAGVPFENRKYVPHVTLARFRASVNEAEIARFMQTHTLFSGDPFEVEDFILYRTHQTKNGSAYEELAHYPLVQKPEKARSTQ